MKIEKPNILEYGRQDHFVNKPSTEAENFILSLEEKNEDKDTRNTALLFSPCEKYTLTIMGGIFFFLELTAGISALILNFQEDGDEICDDNGRCEKLDKEKTWEDLQKTAIVSGVGLSCILLWIMQKKLRQIYAQHRHNTPSTISGIDRT